MAARGADGAWIKVPSVGAARRKEGRIAPRPMREAPPLAAARLFAAGRAMAEPLPRCRR